MQTFLISPSFDETAQVLDFRRLGKERVETLQILQCLKCGPYQSWDVLDQEWIPYESNYLKKRKTPWFSHPAVKMWKNFESALVDYGLAMCKEWTKRGYKDTCATKILQVWYESDMPNKTKTMPPFLGDEKFHSSHRAALLYKNFDYYKKYGWTEKPELNYIWPI